MAAVGFRTRPLVAVLSQVPLFVEALTGAFGEIADIRGIDPADVAVDGLLHAFSPDAVIADADVASTLQADIPCLRVDLRTQETFILSDGDWTLLPGESSPEAIRNVVVAQLYGARSA